MTSKTSFSKYLKENIRHRGWLAAVSWILLFLTGPVYAMVTWENRFTLLADAPEQIPYFLASFPGMLNGNTAIPLAAAIFLLALFCAVTGFSYLHVSEKVDFYHSFPLKRDTWFGISYTGGLLIFLVPYLASALCTLLIGLGKRVVTASLLPSCLLAVLGAVLGFLVIYHMTILAMMLTGNLVTGVLAALVISVYGSIVGQLIRSLASLFFDTYSSNSFHTLSEIGNYLSPLRLFLLLLNRSASVSPANDSLASSIWISSSMNAQSLNLSASSVSMPFGSFLALLFFAAAVLLVFVLASLLLYRHRPSEAAGHALAYPKTAPFIKVLIAVPTALSAGPFLISMYGSNSKWVIPIGILSVLLLCGIIEFIYHPDLRKIFSGYRSSLVSLLSVIGILCIFSLDLFGYDRWLPKENSLEHMAVFTDNFQSYFSYIPASYIRRHHPEIYRKDTTLTENCAPLYRLAQEGIENTEMGITPDQIWTSGGLEDYMAVTLQFDEGNFSSTFRTYAVKKTNVLEVLDTLCQDTDYRRQMFPFFQLDSSDILGISLLDIYSQNQPLDLSHEEQLALLDAYEKDLLEADLHDMQNSTPIGEFVIDIPEYEDVETQVRSSTYSTARYSIPSFYLYENYTHSLSLLEQYGYTLRTKIQAEDVVSLILMENDIANTRSHDTVYADTSYLSAEAYNASSVTDSEKIKEILKQVQYPAGRLLGKTEFAAYSVEIMLKGETVSHYYDLEGDL